MRLSQAPRLLVSSLLLTGILPVAAEQPVGKPGARVPDVLSQTWSTGGQLVGYLSTRRNGKDTDLYIVDPRDPTSDRLIAECKAGGHTFAETAPDRSRSVVIERMPVDGVDVDPSMPNARRWTTREAGDLDPGANVEPRRLDTTSFDNLAISGVLYRPDLARFGGRQPLIFYIRGAPDGPSRPDVQGRNTCLLNELGIAILYPNGRGSVPSAPP